MTRLAEFQTPALVLDASIMESNIGKMQSVARSMGVGLRPHGKTPKSIHVARRLHSGLPGGLCVSTLKEAEEYVAGGFADLFYTVALAPQKTSRAIGLLNAGAKLTCLIDSLAAAAAIRDALPSHDVDLPLIVELDVDGHRTGIDPADPEFMRLAGVLHRTPGLSLAGIMSYAGKSYELEGTEAVAELAERHRRALLSAATRLAEAGLPCPTVSFGSTPAILHAKTLSGMTELRCGIYVFQDLFQAAIGTCRRSDIALSVLTTVIGVRPDRNAIVIDAGSLALSKDLSTRKTAAFAGYGLVCGDDGQEIPDLYVETVNQEIGIVTSLSGRPIALGSFRVGRQLRILPNHADLTAAAHDRYLVVEGGDQVIDVWPRFNYW